MKVRLGEGIQFIALMAIGCGIARWAMVEQSHRRVVSIGPLPADAPYPLVRNSFEIFIEDYMRPILAGVVLVLGMSVCFDRGSRRPPRAWGSGRWGLATCSLATLVVFVHFFVKFWRHAYVNSLTFDLSDTLARMFSGWIVEWGQDYIALGVLTGFLACKLARWPRDPSPDLTEWTGRISLSLLVLTTLVYGLVMVN